MAWGGLPCARSGLVAVSRRLLRVPHVKTQITQCSPPLSSESSCLDARLDEGAEGGLGVLDVCLRRAAGEIALKDVDERRLGVPALRSS